MRRLWTIALVAETFHVLPSVVARDLDEDPERLSLMCVPLLSYANAKSNYESVKTKKERASLRGALYDSVEENTFRIAGLELKTNGS